MNVANLPQVMVTMAQNRALPEGLRSVVGGIAQGRNVVLARIWLIEPGDICATCRLRPECPDQTRCLHLVASAGNPDDPEHDYTRLDGAFRRFPLGVRKIGHVGKTGEPLLLPVVRGDENWIAERKCIKRSGIHTVAAQPLTFHGEVLGVLAIFDKGVLGDEDFRWLRVFADHAAVSIANARAFAEIESLRARLEEENKYLCEEIRSAHNFGDIIGESPGLRKVMQQIQLVAPTEAIVLITGESGTGKELVALAIHDHSPRKGRALIKVNCGAIPENLSKANSLGTCAARSRARCATSSGGSNSPTAARSFSTKLGKSRCPCRPSCCGSCKSRKLNASVTRARARSTCALLPPPTAI